MTRMKFGWGIAIFLVIICSTACALGCSQQNASANNTATAISVKPQQPASTHENESLDVPVTGKTYELGNVVLDIQNDPTLEILSYVSGANEISSQCDSIHIIYYDSVNDCCYRLRISRFDGNREGGIDVQERLLTWGNGEAMTRDEVIARL